jgi:hypothetical protein
MKSAGEKLCEGREICPKGRGGVEVESSLIVDMFSVNFDPWAALN